MQSNRRAFMTGLASYLLAPSLLGRVSHPVSTAFPGTIAAGFSVHELSFAGKRESMQRTRVYVPQGLTDDRAWPVAVLLHGYAQAQASDRALAAWRAEYNVLEAYSALRQGSILRTPSLGEQRAQQIEQELAEHPFSGMVLVTPITPIPYFQRDLGHTLQRYTDWIHGELLPEVAKVAPISSAPEHVGLAGVSMGGLVGLELMWRFPERFGAYCGIQIAIKRAQAHHYAWLLQRAFNDINGGHGRPIRVVTATGDTYRWSNQAFYEALVRQKLEASLQLRRGAHTARWMRQAGSLESLLWLDQTLNRQHAVPAAPELLAEPSPTLREPD